MIDRPYQIEISVVYGEKSEIFTKDYENSETFLQPGYKDIIHRLYLKFDFEELGLLKDCIEEIYGKRQRKRGSK